MNKGLIAAIVIILVLGIGGFAIMSSRDDNTQTDSTATSPSPAPTSNNTNPPVSEPARPAAPAPAASQTNGSNGITYTDDGFAPNTLTVAKGTTVTITNNSSEILQFASDPHPQHTDHPEINAGSIAAGQSKTITMDEAGTYKYHNHAKASDMGTIVVE